MTAVAPPPVHTGIPGRETVIWAQGLHKHYGSLAAVRGIDLEVKRGEIFGLIGPDGAGKTTTFQILAGVMEASGGEVRVLGDIPRQARQQVGYLTQQFSLYLDLSIDENIRYTGGLRRIPAADLEQRREQYLTLMGLDRFGERLAGQLSGGMKQKLALCCALVAQPQVLLLDEPTTGVDPVSRREFWDLLATVAREGITIVVATPYLDEAERCHRIALMYEGSLQQTGTLAQLRAELGLERLELRTPDLAGAEQVLQQALQEGSRRIADLQSFGDRLDILVKAARQDEALVRSLLAQAGIPVQGLVRAEPTLENVFVSRLRQQGSQGGAAQPAIPSYRPFPHTRARQAQGSSQPEGSAITATGLTKVFGSFTAVRDIHLAIPYGEIYGLLGANGAGKTTVIKMLCGLVPATSGEMVLGGERSNLRSAALRRRIG
ncbi:MAG: ATP-binding cassette domain-containing protein, partial [Cyanobacteriota bacterium]